MGSLYFDRLLPYIRLSQQILKENVHITTSWCCFKTMHIDWDNIVVTGISDIKIDMPSDAKVSIFTDNDLTHINDYHFEINLIDYLTKYMLFQYSHPDMIMIICMLM